KSGFFVIVDDEAAAFGTNLTAAEIGGSAAKGFVGDVEAVLDARVCGAVKAMGSEEQVEFAQGLDGIGEERFDGMNRLPDQGAGGVRRSEHGADLDAGLVGEE